MSRTNTVAVPYGVCSFLNKGYVLSVINHTAVEHLSAFGARDVNAYCNVFLFSVCVYADFNR